MQRLMAAIAALGVLAAVSLLLGYSTVYSWARAVYRAMPQITIAGSVLPSPSGPFGVGRSTISVPLTASNSAASRHMLVDLWYPTSRRDAPAQRPGAGVVGMGLNQRARAGAEVGAPVATASTPFPLLVYAPGWGGPRHDNTFALANLASHGYVVAAIDDIGFAPIDREEGRETGLDVVAFDLSSDEAVRRTMTAANTRLKLMSARVSATLDGLAALDKTGGVPLSRGSIDHSRAGMLGFSFGGAVAAESALGEPRLIAVANLDGTLYGDAAATIIAKPYLVLNSDVPSLEADATSSIAARRNNARLDLADRAQLLLQARRSDTIALLFKQVDHVDFMDALFSPSLTSYLKHWRRTSTDRLRLQEIQDSYLLAFFDWHLRGLRHRPLLSQNPPPFPGVEFLAAAATRSR